MSKITQAFSFLFQFLYSIYIVFSPSWSPGLQLLHLIFFRGMKNELIPTKDLSHRVSEKTRVLNILVIVKDRRVLSRQLSVCFLEIFSTGHFRALGSNCVVMNPDSVTYQLGNIEQTIEHLSVHQLRDNKSHPCHRVEMRIKRVYAM